jgi:hypothetical protein
MATIANYFNVHYATISRWVKGYEGKIEIYCNARLDPVLPSNIISGNVTHSMPNKSINTDPLKPAGYFKR